MPNDATFIKLKNNYGQYEFPFFIKMTCGNLYGKSRLDTCLYLKGVDF
jgi:hypothetical protein